MNNYISIDTAIEKLNQLERESHHNSVFWPFHVEECRKALREIEPADVRPVVHGKWLKPKFPYAWYKCECDQCGYKAPDSGWTLEPYETDHGEKLYRDFVKDHPFCTGCGADMREVTTE